MTRRQSASRYRLSGGTDVVSIVTVPDRRVGADAEREREEGDRGERRGPGERSQRVPHVARETIQHQGVRWFRPEKRCPWTPCISSTFPLHATHQIWPER